MRHTQKQIRLKPDAWVKLTGIVVIDPDGWDRKNFHRDWAKPLTLPTFLNKASNSTTMGYREEPEAIIRKTMEKIEQLLEA
jgi:hypothetical protein